MNWEGKIKKGSVYPYMLQNHGFLPKTVSVHKL